MSDGFIEYDEDFESTSDESSDISSEVSSEVSSEISSEIVIDNTIPESTISQIKDMHTISIMALAMFGSMFFLWVFDFLYKKLSHLF